MGSSHAIQTHIYFLFALVILGTPLHNANANNIPEVPSILDQDSGKLDLELAKIRLKLEKKDYESGLSDLTTMAMQDLDNLEILHMKASTELELEKWDAAHTTISHGLTKYPDDKILMSLRKALINKHRSYLGVGTEYRRVGGSRTEYFGFLKGRTRLAHFTFIGFEGRHNRIYARDITRPKTGLSSTERVNRQRGKVFVQHYFDGGHEAEIGVYGTTSSVGGYGRVSLKDNYGTTSFEGHLRKPEWDASENIIYNGTKDSLVFGREIAFTDNLKFSGALGWHNYNADNLHNLVKTFSGMARLGYTFYEKDGFKYLPGADTSLTFSYTYDAEYPYLTTNAFNGFNEYRPLSITRSENHGPEVYLSTYFIPQLQGAIFGGYSFSRFVKSTPYGGAMVDYTIDTSVKLGLTYEHAVDSDDRAENVDRVTANITYLFD